MSDPFLIHFILDQAEAQPLKKRIAIYRALAPELEKRQRSELLAIAEALEAAEANSTQFLFNFSN